MANSPRFDQATVVQHLATLIPLHLLRSPEQFEDVVRRWHEQHRVWHGPEHLMTLIERITTSSSDDRETLLLTALYHDAIYDPRRADNEEASAELLRAHAADATQPIVSKAIDLIIASKWSTPPASPLTWRFWEWDCEQLAPDYPLSARLAYERAVSKEYQWASWPVYRTKRREFLEHWCMLYPQHKAGTEACIELMQGLAPSMAIYPGSFNPFHRGHLSTLRQAEMVFDKVIIGLAINRQKAGSETTLATRASELQDRLRFHEVAAIPGLLTDYLESLDYPLSVVRGVRDGTDLEAELRYSRFLEELRPGTNTVWIGCEPSLQHLSSSAIRELNSITPNAGDRYVPDTGKIYALVP